jgi:hypothetical protein
VQKKPKPEQTKQTDPLQINYIYKDSKKKEEE